MATTQLHLVSLEDGQVVKEYSAGKVIKIGRGPSWSSDSADLSSGTFRSHHTKSMSQDHATLSWEGDQPVIQDNKSTNGTWVEIGGKRKAITGSTKHFLENGQVLIFGKEISAHDMIHQPLRLKVELVTIPPPPEVTPDLVQANPEPDSVDQDQADLSQTQQPPPVIALALEDDEFTPVVKIGRKLCGFGLSENELVEDSGSDMNLDTDHDVALIDDDEIDEEEEVISDGEATGWHQSVDKHKSGWTEIEHATLDAANSVQQAIEGLGGVGSSPSSIKLDPVTVAIESEANTPQTQPDSDQDALLEVEYDVDQISDDDLNDFHGAKARRMSQLALSQFELDDDETYSLNHSPILSPSQEPDLSDPIEVAEYERSLFGDHTFDSDMDKNDDALPSSTDSVPQPSQNKAQFAVVIPPPTSAIPAFPALSQRPPGRVPSPFSLPTVVCDEPVIDASASPLPSPEPSPEHPKRKNFAKRTKPVPRIVDDEDDHDHDPVEAEPVRKRPLARDYSSRHKLGSVYKPKKDLFNSPRVGLGSYGTIRRPRASRYLGESEDDECASQTSHLPSPENSPDRTRSPELVSEPKFKRARIELAEPKSAKVDWTPVIELLEPAAIEHDDGSVLEGIYDGLDEVDGDVEAGLEIDGDALKESDEVGEEVDMDEDALVEAAVAEAEEVKLASEDGLAKLLAELDELKSVSHDIPKRSALFELDHKPKIVPQAVSSTSSAHPPSGLSSPSPHKRNRDHLDDQAVLSQIVQDCVTHVAEEARASQSEAASAPAATAAVAPEVDQPAIAVESEAVAVPAVKSVPAETPAADKVVSTQTEPIEVEAPRAIAPLPKRARGRGLVTFLSGMAVAVVGMECLGILAGMMEE